MSQIYKSVSSTPSVPTTFHTDLGDAVPASNIINLYGNTSSVFNSYGIQTFGSGNIVDITLMNRFYATASNDSSGGVVTTNLIVFALDTSSRVYRFYFDVAGRETTSGDGAGYRVEFTAKTDGTTAAVIATPNIDTDEDTSLSGAVINAIASGNTVEITFQGVAGTIVSLATIGYYTQV